MQNRMYPYGQGSGYGYGQGGYGNPNVNPNANYPNPNISPNMNYPVSPNMNYPVSPNMNVNIPISPKKPNMNMDFGKYPKKEESAVSPAEEVKGNNFLGVTEKLCVCPCPSPGESVWASLVNPASSNVNLAVKRITISNMTCSPLVAQLYFKPTLPFNGKMSSNITPADLSKTNSRPKGQIQFGTLPNSPVNGVVAATRIIPAYKSVTIDLDGLWVVAQGTNVMVFLKSPYDDSTLSSVVSFEWEEK